MPVGKMADYLADVGKGLNLQGTTPATMALKSIVCAGYQADQTGVADGCGGAVGSASNRVFNPLNPNKVAWDGWLPDQAWMNELASYIQDSVAVRTLYAGLSGADKAKAMPALNLLGRRA